VEFEKRLCTEIKAKRGIEITVERRAVEGKGLTADQLDQIAKILTASKS
jgi:hypothetical protein